MIEMSVRIGMVFVCNNSHMYIRISYYVAHSNKDSVWNAFVISAKRDDITDAPFSCHHELANQQIWSNNLNAISFDCSIEISY